MKDVTYQLEDPRAPGGVVQYTGTVPEYPRVGGGLPVVGLPLGHRYLPPFENCPLNRS